MRTFINYVLGVASVFVALSSKAQVANQRYAADNYRPLTPGAYSFFKYIDNPTDLYHGIPLISIPLYTIRVGDKSFPLDFTYHAGGIRVTEEASWIGLGWDFSLPTVVQTINDEDDLTTATSGYYGYSYVPPRIRPDWPSPAFGGISYPKRFTYGSYTDADGQGWYSPYPSTTKPAVELQHRYRVSYDYYLPVNTNFTIQQQQMFEGVVDSEPDVFKIDLFGTALSFIKDFNTGAIKLLNNPVYKVTTTTDGWDVVDGEGYTYHFANKQIHTTTSTDDNCYGGSSSLNVPSVAMWYLSTITSPQGRQASFLYDNLPTRTTVDFKQKYQRGVKQNTTYNYCYTCEGYSGNLPSTAGVGLYPDSIYATKSFTHEAKKYINRINSDNGNVIFYSSARTDISSGQKLDSVQVVDYYNNTVLKHLSLAHDYFSADASASTIHAFSTLDEQKNTVQQNNSRLRLLALTESTTGTYHFTYDPQPLPPRNSFAQDFWGYYNGAYFNTCLIPNSHRLRFVPGRIADNGTNNGAVLQYARAGTLTNITFPTGGNKAFTYELNTFTNSWVPDYDSLNNKVSKGNGLRIKRIISTTQADAPPLVTEYSYAGGRTMFETKYYRQIEYTSVYNQTYGNPQAPDNPNGLSYDNYALYELKENSQYSPSLLGSGTGVGYASVREQQISGYATAAPGNAGTTIHYYANYPDSNVNSENSYEPYELLDCTNISLPAYQNPVSTKNGLEDSVKYLDAAGKLVKKTVNTYLTTSSLLDYGAKIFSKGRLWITRIEFGIFHFYPYSRNLIGFYPLFEKTSYKLSEVSTLYSDSGTPFTQKTVYQTDSYFRTTRRSELNFTQTVDGLPTYFAPGVAYSYTYPDGRRGVGDRLLIAANRLNEPVGIYEAHGINPNLTPKVSGTAYSYEKFFGQGATGAVLDTVLETHTYPADHSSRQRITRFGNYDSFDRHQQAVSGVSRPIAYLWHSQLPLLLAEVKNAASGTVAYTSFEPQTTENWSLNSSPIAGGVTGNACMQLVNGLASPALGLAGTYKFSCWAKGAIPQLSVSVGTSAISLPRAVTTRPDGWTQYQATISTSAPGARVIFGSSATGLIDEIRLYPVDAQMTSYTYSPWQTLSSQTDPTGRLITYEYDAAGRLVRARDEQGRILAQQQYHYAQP